MLESSIKNFNQYAPYLSKKTIDGLASLVLENMSPSEELMQNLVLRDTGKITEKEFLKKELERMDVPSETQPQRNKIPLWTQDEAIAFECAKEAIGHMIAICSSLIYKEECKEHPDVKRILQLEEKQNLFEDERINLHWYEKEKIAKFRQEYGAKIKNYRAGGECPV